MNDKNKQKKFKRIIHQFKASTHSKVREEKQNERVKRPDDNINFISATFQDVKQGERSHELNRIRRLAIKFSLNKYEHPASNHEKLEPYQKTSDWLNWIGIVSDISMPTGKSGMLDGKILVDKFSFENNKGQKELLDYHIWLPVNEIKFLLNSQSQIVGIGDIIRGKSRVLQYLSKGHGIKFGLGATLIKDIGIYISFKKIGSEHVAIGQRLENKYDRFDDWVLKLSNNGVPLKTVQEYKDNNDINVFAQNTSGHVSAIYQPSKYDHYFDRLSPLEVKDNEDVKTQTYTAKVRDFDVKKYDGQTIPIIHLVNITNEYNRLISAGGWYQYDMSLSKLGILRQKDEIKFTATPQFFKNHTEKQTLNDPVLLTNRKVEKLPDNLLFGWIMAQKKIKNPSEKVQNWINEYECWVESKTKSSEVGNSIEGKTKNAPKIIQRSFCLHINTSEGTFINYEFKGIEEAYEAISKLGRKENHNEFVRVYDLKHKLRFISIKDIKSFS